MARNLRDRVVVITGASSGIGQATALAFAKAGARLVLAARDAAALQMVAKTCREIGSDVLVAPTDVTDAGAVRALAERAMSFGRIDVWVSNVGVGAVGRFHETPIEAHQQVIRANLVGHINDAHAVIPIFIKQRRGTFINMVSVGGFAATPFAVAYSASKFGLRGFSEALRAELSNFHDIHICDIHPSFVDTPGLLHGANYMRRAVRPPPGVSDPRTVAAAIVRTARNPHDVVTVGPLTNLIRFGHFLAPGSSARIAAWMMRRYFKQADRVPASSGNLYRPPADPGGIDGGFRSKARNGYGSVLLICLCLGMALGVAAQRGGKRRHLVR